MKTSYSEDLLLRISRCPNLTQCLANPYIKHPCSLIVSDQEAGLDEFQVPEPWSGHIASAPILFISSNPSISKEEKYPVYSWSDEAMIDYFENRFSGKWTNPTRDRILLVDGEKAVSLFLAAVSLRI